MSNPGEDLRRQTDNAITRGNISIETIPEEEEKDEGAEDKVLSRKNMIADSSNYNENDPPDNESFKFEIGEPKNPSALKTDFRYKMNLPSLKLPVDPPEIPSTGIDNDNDDSSEENSPMAPPVLVSRKAFRRGYGRTKTRLMDRPPPAPAVRNQLNRCAYAYKNNIKASCQSPLSSGPLSAFSTLSNAIPKSDSTVPEVTPPRKSDTPVQQSLKPTMIASTVEEEQDQDPSDDDSVPDYKKKKNEESKWFLCLQWTSLLLLITLLICSMEIPSLKEVVWLDVNLWRWQALTLVIFSGRLISGWIVKLFVVLIERQCLLKKRVLYFVYGLRRSVKNCIWLALVIAVWEVIYSPHRDTVTVQYITKVLWCLFTAALSWMVKILAVKVAANSFHRAAYFDRIQDCLFNQFLLETLSGPSTMAGNNDSTSGQAVTAEPAKIIEGSTSNNPNNSAKDNLPSDAVCIQGLPGLEIPTGEADAGGPATEGQTSTTQPLLSFGQTSNWKKSNAAVPLITRSPLPIEQHKLQELTSETVSAGTLKKCMKLIRNTNMTTYSSMLSDQGEWEIGSEIQAKAAAKKIFYNMARPGQKFLTFEDFLYFLQEHQAARAYALFEHSEDGTITKKALVKWVVSVYKERKALALTLNDNKTVVGKLHNVLNALVTIILIIACLLIIGVNTNKLLVFFSSIFIPSVFVFGNSAKTTFESLIFLFVIHPYDVGDRIIVDGQSMIVEEMNVLNTILLTASNEKIYYPNAVLACKAISNLYRSPDQWDSIDFQIHISTPVEKLGILKDRMQRYIENLPQFWYPDFSIVCKDIEDCNKMKMAIWMQHHINFQEGGERFQRRSSMLLYMKQQMEELNISYQLPPQEIAVKGIPVLDAYRPPNLY